MPLDQRIDLDATDVALLRLLQDDGRTSTADLARAVSMSASSTADRLRRLTDLGVVRGYRVDVDPVLLGYPLLAFVRLRLTAGVARTFADLLADTPQVLEAHHVTGEDCYLLKVVARSMEDLEAVTATLATFGHVTTNLVFSSPVTGRPIPTSGPA